MRKLVLAGVAVLTLGVGGGVYAASEAVPNRKVDWSFDGVFGSFDRAQLKRGWEVYNNVCTACHSLKLVAYRNLSAVGLTADEIKKLAADKEYKDALDKEGEPKARKGLPSDRILGPAYANPVAARAANNGALPPDLSLIVKARFGGSNYLYSLLTGYGDPPKDLKDTDGKPFKLEEGQHYNKHFSGFRIAMAPPLTDEGQVEYTDKTKATVDQMARDVTAFLSWAAEPELADRKRMGLKVIAFLLLLTAVFYAVKRKIWSDQH